MRPGIKEGQPDRKSNEHKQDGKDSDRTERTQQGGKSNDRKNDDRTERTKNEKRIK